jgi:hypothetical protein
VYDEMLVRKRGRGFSDAKSPNIYFSNANLEPPSVADWGGGFSGAGCDFGSGLHY